MQKDKRRNFKTNGSFRCFVTVRIDLCCVMFGLLYGCLSSLVAIFRGSRDNQSYWEVKTPTVIMNWLMKPSYLH